MSLISIRQDVTHPFKGPTSFAGRRRRGPPPLPDVVQRVGERGALARRLPPHARPLLSLVLLPMSFLVHHRCVIQLLVRLICVQRVRAWRCSTRLLYTQLTLYLLLDLAKLGRKRNGG